MSDYRTLNRANWDDRAQAHADSPMYSFQEFVADPRRISEVVQHDLALLGDLSGLRVAHLQCHIGTDTLSLARLGARVTGLDFSPRSLEQARRLAEQAGASIEYVESDVYQAGEVLGAGGFDLVYTGIGALCWLPDIARWARTVAGLLRPGGRLFIRECHPVLWAVDDERKDDLIELRHSYFERAEPLIWDDAGTYAVSDARFEHNVTHQWNHGLAETVTAVLDAGMTLTGLSEQTSVPWDALPGRMRQVELGEWQLSDRPERLPHSYTLQAVRNAV